MAIAYTNHIGRSSRDKHSGKNTAISSLSDLAATERHNNHDYTQEDVGRMQSAIDLELRDLNRQYVMIDGEFVEIEGHLDLEANVRQIYEEQFAESVKKYNQKQVAGGHPERQIESYIEKISEDKQQEVAVEGLIQYGSLEDWEGRPLEDRLKVVPLLLEGLQRTLDELKTEDAEFILAGASVHLNEGTPHLHYVGVPVQETPNAKNGMDKRVRKGAVFTKESLSTGMQDNVRAAVEPELKARFGWEFEKKRTGRNEDLDKNTYVNEQLKNEIQEKEKAAGALEALVHVAAGTVEEQITGLVEGYKSAMTEKSAGQFDDAMFLVSNCSSEQLAALSAEGKKLKEQLIGAVQLQGKEHLDGLIEGIQKGQMQDLSWDERQKQWDLYRKTSQEFWDMRSALLQDFREKRREIADEKIAAQMEYHRALYFLDRAQGLIRVLVGLLWLLKATISDAIAKMRLDQLKWERDLLARNTSNFAAFSREYRDDLKQGKMPCESCLEAMTDIIQTFDKEYRSFEERSKQQQAALKERLQKKWGETPRNDNE